MTTGPRSASFENDTQPHVQSISPMWSSLIAILRVPHDCIYISAHPLCDVVTAWRLWSCRGPCDAQLIGACVCMYVCACARGA